MLVSTARNFDQLLPPTLFAAYTWAEVLISPGIGDNIGGGRLNTDARFDARNGWQKKQYSRTSARGEFVEIHYQYNTLTGAAADIKITSWRPPVL